MSCGSRSAPCSLRSCPGPGRGGGFDLQLATCWPPRRAGRVWPQYLEATRAGSGPVKCRVALEISKWHLEVPQTHGSSGCGFGTNNLPLIVGRWGAVPRAGWLHMQTRGAAQHRLPQWFRAEVSRFLTALLCCLFSLEYSELSAPIVSNSIFSKSRTPPEHG